MGYNTTAMILNDFIHEIEKSPNALTWAICHPPHSDRELETKRWWAQVQSVARQYNENFASLKDILVMPTYHADDRHIILAGWNNLVRVKSEDYKYNPKQNKIIINNVPSYWKK